MNDWHPTEEVAIYANELVGMMGGPVCLFDSSWKANWPPLTPTSSLAYIATSSVGCQSFTD